MSANFVDAGIAWCKFLGGLQAKALKLARSQPVQAEGRKRLPGERLHINAVVIRHLLLKHAVEQKEQINFRDDRTQDLSYTVEDFEGQRVLQRHHIESRAKKQ